MEGLDWNASLKVKVPELRIQTWPELQTEDNDDVISLVAVRVTHTPTFAGTESLLLYMNLPLFSNLLA